MTERHSSIKFDLTGQRFGKLTILEPAENIGSRTIWHCRCSCGQDAVRAKKEAEIYYYVNFSREFASAPTIGADADSNIK